ncbi:MAG TPA: hypothetical protein VJ888_06570 [Mobilitalea sp.]|nr:hypothetical protein [Mobilitalea sp.]
MKEKLRQFMIGRYGADQLSKFTLGAAMVAMMGSLLFGGKVLYSMSLLLLALCYIRMFSRNHTKRYHENNIYLSYKSSILRFLKKGGNTSGKKNYRIYTCPSCRQKIRIPKGKGRISITCPKCRKEFIRRS